MENSEPKLKFAKHTPGPWNLEAGRSIVTSSGAFYLSYGKDKASGAPHFSNFCELDANARLIAAAPDLLAELEKLVKVAGRLGASCAGAKAALAKANGK